MNERVTIMMSPLLKDRVDKYVSIAEISLTDFYNSAILNYLEKCGDFEIRDLLEEESNE